MTNTTNYEKELATLNSPVFTGEPKAPTQDLNSDSKNIAIIGNLQDFAPNPIYFSAQGASENPISKKTDEEQLIKFDKIISQNANDFDPQHSFYNVPVNGIYDINFSLEIAFDSIPTSGLKFPAFWLNNFADLNPKIERVLFIPFQDTGIQRNYFANIQVIIQLTKGEQLCIFWQPYGNSFSGYFAASTRFFTGKLLKKL